PAGAQARAESAGLYSGQRSRGGVPESRTNDPPANQSILFALPKGAEPPFAVPDKPFASFYGRSGGFTAASPAAFSVHSFTSISLAKTAILKALT
ncbi:hypothetical protein, partial [Paenibacillus maysiensis]|uniref:hypothetical protein n=1 Tax=Paenibacillus maysiensis TaxID=1155954 RepID=UPI0004717037